jgi:hypothetical protein
MGSKMRAATEQTLNYRKGFGRIIIVLVVLYETVMLPLLGRAIWYRYFDQWADFVPVDPTFFEKVWLLLLLAIVPPIVTLVLWLTGCWIVRGFYSN